MKYRSFVICALFFLAIIPFGAYGQEKMSFQGNVSGNYWTIGWQQRSTSDFSLGCRINRGNYVGLGSGMHWVIHTYGGKVGPVQCTPFLKAIPFFADYVHYFHFGESLISLYLGLEAGGSFFIDNEICHPSMSPFRLFFNGKLGVDIGIMESLGITLGIHCIVVPSSNAGEYMLAPTIGVRF